MQKQKYNRMFNFQKKSLQIIILKNCSYLGVFSINIINIF